MHTTLSKTNPYGADRYGFAWEHVPQNGEAHLDFGCNDGQFLHDLSKSKHIENLFGLDISRDYVKQAQQLYPELDVRHLTSTTPLPFADNMFDSISILDVIEHVYEQKSLMAEFQRVLKPDGILIMTAPQRHIFSFLDRGNLQLVFPSLFRWYYLRKHSAEEYNYNYVNNPDGLVGCVSAKKRWHEHFSRKKMKKLLSPAKFSVHDFDGTGLLHHVLETIDFILRRPPFLKNPIKWLTKLDNKLFASHSLFCVASKST